AYGVSKVRKESITKLSDEEQAANKLANSTIYKFFNILSSK
ncbi:MAG: hypothetical protein ACJAT7_003440, partial [Psychromonas sp.]